MRHDDRQGRAGEGGELLQIPVIHDILVFYENNHL